MSIITCECGRVYDSDELTAMGGSLHGLHEWVCPYCGSDDYEEVE